MTNTQNILSQFRRIPHRSVGNDTFREWFTKIAWKVYSETTSSIEKSTLKDIELFFNTLFTNKSNDLDEVILLMRKKLRNHSDFEKFLNTLLYQILIYYIKSFDNHPDGWKILSDFIEASQEISAYCSQKENESIVAFDDIFINTMETLRTSKEAFNVLNTYLGVPIQYPASVIHTENDSIIIRTHPIQIISAIIQKGIYIVKNDRIQNDIFASVKVVNIQGQRYLRLYNFNPLRSSLSHRQHIRVQTPAPYTIQLTYGTAVQNCNAHDLSLKGVALVHNEIINISEDQEVILTLPTQITSTAIRLKAKFIFRSSYENRYKYHFKIYPTLSQENLISRYISAREQQIIQSLRHKAQL